MNDIASSPLDLFSGLITSKTRVKILMRLFLNCDQQAHLRKMADEFKVSPSLVREELKQLSRAGLLRATREGKQINYRANTEHALFPELSSIVRKSLGMDRILDSIVGRLGDVEKAILVGDYAEGKDSGLIDLVLIGNIDLVNLNDLVAKTERYIHRKIRTLVFKPHEIEQSETIFAGRPSLVLWTK